MALPEIPEALLSWPVKDIFEEFVVVIVFPSPVQLSLFHCHVALPHQGT